MSFRQGRHALVQRYYGHCAVVREHANKPQRNAYGVVYELEELANGRWVANALSDYPGHPPVHATQDKIPLGAMLRLVKYRLDTFN